MTPPAESRAWYRSLYWRIALGFILFLMGVLVAQGVLFLWVIARSPGERPSPRGLVAVAALDLSLPRLKARESVRASAEADYHGARPRARRGPALRPPEGFA